MNPVSPLPLNPSAPAVPALMPSASRRQRGISLVESLVAVIVTALGVLGILGVQLRTLSDTQTSVRRAQAIRLIEDLTERMRVHPNALGNLNSYVSEFGAVPASSGCAAAACSPTQLVNADVRDWKQSVGRLLPLGDAHIFLPPAETVNANRRQLGILISWRENERDTSAAYKDNIDTSKLQSGGSFVNGAGAAATCPDGRTCHLQYIQVPGRCAPYFLGGATQYFCSGS